MRFLPLPCWRSGSNQRIFFIAPPNLQPSAGDALSIYVRSRNVSILNILCYLSHLTVVLFIFKDKWRNLNVSFCGGSREKSRASRLKTLSPLPGSVFSRELASVPYQNDGFHREEKNQGHQDQMKNTISTKRKRKTSGYSALIIEALNTLKGPNNSEVEYGAIVSFMKQRLQLPANIKRILGPKFRRLIQQNRIEKGQAGYIIKDPSFATKTPQKRRGRPSKSNKKSTQQEGYSAESLGFKIADAETKAVVASEAVKEHERIISMLEESEALMMLIENLYETCKTGEVVRLA